MRDFLRGTQNLCYIRLEFDLTVTVHVYICHCMLTCDYVWGCTFYVISCDLSCNCRHNKKVVCAPSKVDANRLSQLMFLTLCRMHLWTPNMEELGQESLLLILNGTFVHVCVYQMFKLIFSLIQ